MRALGASVEEHLLDGLPDPEVVRLAKTINARFIVIGSLGRSQSERWLLGSVAERVAETAPCPTLVVRDSLPLHAWAQGKFPLRIVCGVDFTATSDAALASLRALSGIGAMEITAAYVSWPFEERERLGIDGGDSPVADSQAVTKIRERDLCERVAAVIGEKKPHIHVEAAHNRVDYTLIEFARASNAGLVAIGTHQIHGLRRLMNPSFSRGILYHAHTNVWCAPLHMEGYHPPVRKLDRILVATDFSDSANAAIRQSYSLLTNGCVVHLLHVLSASPKSRGLPGTRGKSSSLATGVRRAKQDAESKLRRSIPKELSTMRVATEIEVVMLAGALWLFFFELHSEGHLIEMARTAVINVVVVVEIGYLFNCRSLKRSVFAIGIESPSAGSFLSDCRGDSALAESAMRVMFSGRAERSCGT